MQTKENPAAGPGERGKENQSYEENNAARYEKQGFFDTWETRSVSLFQGINPEPTGTTTVFDILNRIKKGTYQKQVEYVRAEKDNKDEYARRKNNLPGVTFSCTVRYRGLNESGKNPKSGPWNLNSTNGLIVADLDHLANLDGVKDTLQTDPNILFVFTSPGGDGLKVGIRADGIGTPEDHTRLYFAVERYFKEAYGQTIDPACKDLARLCFVSFDPDLYINNDACLFDVSAWSPEEKQKSEPPPRYEHNDRGADRRAKYGHKVLENACTKVRQSQPNNQHYERRNAARTVGGFIASGFIDESEAMTAIEQAVIDSGAKNISKAMQTVKDGISNGKQSPLFPDNWNDEPGGSNTHSTSNSENTDWPDPEPLFNLYEPEPFPIDALPPIFRNAVDEVGAYVQAPIPMIISSALGAASIAIQGHYNVKRDEGLTGPVSLFLWVVADSGERKTTVDGYFTAGIRDFESQKRQEMQPEIDAYEREMKIYKAKEDGLLQAIKQAKASEGKNGKI